jgi:hypothetical protein
MIKFEKMKNFKKPTILILSAMLVVLCGSLKAEKKNDPVFDPDEVLNMEITYDIDKFKKDRREKRVYHPAKLAYKDKNGQMISIDVQIRVRGNVRRKSFKCQIPNFKIKFDKDKVKNTIFEGKKPLKMVLHCGKKKLDWENYAIHEYYAYKIYQILNDLSFKTRLARITYHDSQKKIESTTKYGFFIENYTQMVKRNNAKTVKDKPIALQQADFYTSTLIGVFQFLIGNTDWSIRSGHNIRLATRGNSTMYYPIPFDFDLCGLVDADYALPPPELPIPSVRVRLFRGFCKDEKQFAPIFAVFNRHKEKILSLFRDSPFITEKRKNRNIKYIEDFYKIINSPKLVKRYFIKNFRGGPLPKR